MQICLDNHFHGHLMRKLRFLKGYSAVPAKTYFLVAYYAEFFVFLFPVKLAFFLPPDIIQQLNGLCHWHLDDEALNVDQPPSTSFVLDKVADYLREFDARVYLQVL